MRSHEPAIHLAEAPDLASEERRAWRRITWIVVSLLAITGFFACACDAPMIWDGAYQFCLTLIKQHPYSYLTRFHSYVLWLPTVWLSHFTDNLTMLKFAYGLPFTLAPAFSVLASWWMVRDRAPHLILWAIFGAAAGPLPGLLLLAGAAAAAAVLAIRNRTDRSELLIKAAVFAALACVALWKIFHFPDS